MLSSLLVRVAMVALTMGLVCWIGWTIPASRDAEMLHAEGPGETNQSPLLPVPPSTPEVQVTPPSQRHMREFARPSAPLTLDVNRANQRDFQRLPGIGPVLARRIVEYRESQGAFHDIEQLRRVKGIGKKTFERIRAFVAVPPTGITRPARKTA
jgi:competence protein ComEA